MVKFIMMFFLSIFTLNSVYASKRVCELYDGSEIIYNSQDSCKINCEERDVGVCENFSGKDSVSDIDSNFISSNYSTIDKYPCRSRSKVASWCKGCVYSYYDSDHNKTCYACAARGTPRCPKK